jgi:hypothetical protein
MRRTLKIVQATLVTLVLAAFGVSLLQAKPEYTKKEGKNCATCHTKAGSKELNDVGKCYEKNKSLKECK